MFTVAAEDLLKWSRWAEQVQRKIPDAVAGALNTFGQGVVRSAAQQIAENNDLAIDDIMDAIIVKEATAQDLTWSMDASGIALQTNDWQRPWETRDDSANFDKQTLVKIVTAEDHTVCDVCNDAAEKSPYSMQEVDDMRAKWADWKPPPGAGVRTNLVHPNCRCVLQPWSMMRRLPLTMGTSSAAPPELFTARQLGQAVAAELKVAISVKG